MKTENTHPQAMKILESAALTKAPESEVRILLEQIQMHKKPVVQEALVNRHIKVYRDMMRKLRPPMQVRHLRLKDQVIRQQDDGSRKAFCFLGKAMVGSECHLRMRELRYEWVVNRPLHLWVMDPDCPLTDWPDIRKVKRGKHVIYHCEDWQE